MPTTPSAAAQAIASAQGAELAALAVPQTALQTAIANGSLAPAAMIDPLLSIGAQSKIIDTFGPASSSTTSSTSFVNMPSGGSGTFTAPIAKPYMFHVDMCGIFESTAAAIVGFQMLVNGVAVTPNAAMNIKCSEVSSRKYASWRQIAACNAGSNSVQLQWKVSVGTATWDTDSAVVVTVTG